MKILHARLDPTASTSFHFVVVQGEGAASLDTNTLLRCGAYRFRVVKPVEVFASAPVPTASLLLESADPPTEGMVVHLAAEPLTQEELTIAVQHLLMLPRLLKGIDATGVHLRLEAASPMSPQATHLAYILANFSKVIASATEDSPLDAAVAELERYKDDILRAC